MKHKKKLTNKFLDDIAKYLEKGYNDSVEKYAAEFFGDELKPLSELEKPPLTTDGVILNGVFHHLRNINEFVHPRYAIDYFDILLTHGYKLNLITGDFYHA